MNSIIKSLSIISVDEQKEEEIDRLFDEIINKSE